jgi:Post-segregation antitoxin CcdA
VAHLPSAASPRHLTTCDVRLTACRDGAGWTAQGNLGAEPGLRGYARCPDHVYSMRMARVNITVPDDLLIRARAAGLNVSRLAAAALADELDRQTKLGELDAYLADLDAELGPVPQHELKAAREWADAVLPAGRGGSARQARSA